MKELLKRLEQAIERANAADEQWEKTPNDKECEREFDRAYKAEYKIREELAAEIVRLANEIEFKTALKMTYNPNTIELLKAYK